MLLVSLLCSRVNQEVQAYQGLMAIQDRRDHQAHLGREDWLDLKVALVYKDFQVKKESPEIQDHEVHQEVKVKQDQMEIPALW